MMKERFDYRTLIVDIIYDVASALFFAVGLSCFSAPNEIAPGGVSGIAVLVQYLFGLQLGTVSLLINIPLLLLAWKLLGRDFTFRTLKTVAIQTVVLNYIAPHFPVYRGEYIIAALFGGVFIGVSLALVFMRGSTTGGADIVSRLVQRKLRHLPIGKLMLGF
ncbi:MAG: YitT family protein, partial [Angelakisella sp.]